MTKRNIPHLVIPSAPRAESFSTPNRGNSTKTHDFQSDRETHGRQLKRQLEKATTPKREDPSRSAKITFVSFPEGELKLESLESQAVGEQPQLLSVNEQDSKDGVVQQATVYVPAGSEKYFLKRLTQYLDTAENEKPAHAPLIEGIEKIQPATIQTLWTDPVQLLPTDKIKLVWWEVWLRKQDGNEQARFVEYAREHDLRTSDHYLGFESRTVVLLQCTTVELSEAIKSIDDIAELRRPHDVASFLGDLPSQEQAEWMHELTGRVRPALDGSPTVSILDTGVQDGHILLKDSLAQSDIHVADPSWSKIPTCGHGTEMAGLALYGSLEDVMSHNQPVDLKHRLESIKLLPSAKSNDPDLYGALTVRAVNRPEIAAANRSRVFMLAITASQPSPHKESGKYFEPGKPTSWSSTIDALAYGRSIDDTSPSLAYLDRDETPFPRLFVISAGNILPRDLDATQNHLDRSDLEPIEDPAQAWNALTVGAYSETDNMSGADPSHSGYAPVAPRGQLSPVSRTSVLFDRKKWPFKPDVVADGGNLAVSPDATTIDTPQNLALLTSRFQQLGVGGVFTTTRDTSAATAQVAAIAADIHAAYPTLRPETVRALIVQSAQWTDAMQPYFDPRKYNKTQMISHLRRYGMGVPDADRALRSANDALTLIAEAQIRPYERQGNSNAGKAREMNLHQLPWPKSALEELGETQVKLRVTLSYFIEPNPSRRGWSGRYLYPSHGLRFAMRRADESTRSFRERINLKARPEERKAPRRDTEKGWLFGIDQQQAPGSLHTDIWTGLAIDLASKSDIAVYPVGGWWKNQKARDQSDHGVQYSLTISIESPEVYVDLLTPIKQQIASTIEIES